MTAPATAPRPSAIVRNGWRFWNFPALLPRSAYDVAREEFVSYYATAPGVQAVFRFGSVSYPGLSDLDFLVVLADDYRPTTALRYDLAPFGEQTRYILYHPQFFLPRSLFSSLSRLVPLFEIEKVAGQDCGLSESSDAEQRELDAMFLSESLITDFAWGILGSSQRRQVDLRMAQARLNLVARNLAMLQNLTGAGWPRQAEFCRAVADYRAGWFERSAEQTCDSSLELLAFAGDAVAAMGETLTQHVAAHWPMPAGARSLVYRYNDVVVEFRSDAGTVAPVPSSTDLRVQAPLALAAPLLWLSAGAGPVSRFVRNHMEGAFMLAAPAPPVIQQANDNANRHCQFLRAARIPTGCFRYWGYRSSYAPGLRTYLRRFGLKLGAMKSSHPAGGN